MRRRDSTLTTLTIGLMLLAGAPALPGCESESGSFEEAGEKVDESIEEAGDSIEEAADELEDATDPGQKGN